MFRDILQFEMCSGFSQAEAPEPLDLQSALYRPAITCVQVSGSFSGTPAATFLLSRAPLPTGTLCRHFLHSRSRTDFVHYADRE
jgi:hypothetical protein